MAQGVRRVITGHDGDGKAVVVTDDVAFNVTRPKNRPGVALHQIWATEEAPARLAGNAETTDRVLALEPSAAGSIFRIIEFPPEAGWIGNVDRGAARRAFASMGAEHAVDPSVDPPHPLMHKTETIDYLVVLSGEVYLVLDDSEVLLTAGDTVVQRGTNHAWSNRSTDVCRLAAVLIDGRFAAPETG